MKKYNADISFLDKLEKLYFEMAFTELAMDYYCLKERDSDSAFVRNESGTDFRGRIEKLVEKCIFDYDNILGIATKADELRNEIKTRVGFFVNKIDRLELKKYVEERSGNEKELFTFANDDEAAKEVLRSIFSSNDNPLINERIKNAVYELPVRMTKNRFFDILKDGLKKYIGQEQDVLERVIYLLESSSGLSGDALTDEFADFSDDAVYKEYDYLDELAGICNYICAIVRVSEEVRNSEKENIENILKLINVSSELNENKAEEAEEILTKLEGKLETLSEGIAFFEAKLSGYLESSEDPVQKAIDLEVIRRLLSPSRYAEIEPEIKGETKEADEDDVTREFEKLSMKLSDAFKNGTRELNRARMAGILSMLPVFFNSRTEVMDYVRSSLASCSSAHEKNVAVSKILSQDF